MTDSASFQELVASVSVRENEGVARLERGGIHTGIRRRMCFGTFADADFRLGFNAAQTTLGGIARIVGVRVK
jgi:hypothetical protein